MDKILKVFDIEVVERKENGGRIVISTGAKDRYWDRVFPEGARVDNYLRNPVVQWGHNYWEPWATIGRTTGLEVTPEGITAEFELRPAASENDPQNIVLALWEGEWIRTASIGFNPVEFEENEDGGLDYTSWELLEWSLVPVPANQEALRLAVKGLDVDAVSTVGTVFAEEWVQDVTLYEGHPSLEEDEEKAEDGADGPAVLDPDEAGALSEAGEDQNANGGGVDDGGDMGAGDSDELSEGEYAALGDALGEFVEAVGEYLD